MTTASTISTLFGKMARFSQSKWRRFNYEFICPNCLHFGGSGQYFAFACGECWAEIPGYSDGNKPPTCPHCQRSLLSADGGGVRAYCRECLGNWDRAIYHQRQVRVLATLRPSDSASLYRAISGQEYQPQGGKGCVYDDGTRLAYVLNLGDFTDEAHSLRSSHALRGVGSIWLDMPTSNPKELALELGEAIDRFFARSGLIDLARLAWTVCVNQAEADPAVRHVLEARFWKVMYGVTGAAFLCERAQAKVGVLGEIGHGSTVPALLAELKGRYGDMRWDVVEALSKIGEPAVPALIAALREGDMRGRGWVAEVLGKIGKPAVPGLIAALKGHESDVRSRAVEALGKIGDDSAMPELIAGLKGRDLNIRWKAAEALGEIGNPAVPALITALKEGDAGVRKKATDALAKIGDDSAVPALIEVLKDRHEDVRGCAAKALGEIGDKIAVSALEAADRENHNGNSCNFCDALRRLGAK